MDATGSDAVARWAAYGHPLAMLLALAAARFQFERLGYFCVDSVKNSSERLVFIRTVGLRDTWAKQATVSAAKQATVSAAKQAKR